MKPHQPDYILFIVIILLLLLGIVTLFSASSVKGEFQFRDPTYYIKHQLIYGIIPGLIFFALGYFIEHRILRKLSLLILLLSLGLLFLIFLPQFGLSFKGATRWIKLGPISLQPSEFFKLGFIIYMASFFASRQGKLSKTFEVTVPFIIILAFVGLVLLWQPAAGTFGIIGIIGLGIYVLAGGKTRDIILLILIGAFAISFIALSTPYRRARIESFLNPLSDPQGASYQLNQALISIGSGGIWGAGIGHSRQKYNFLPETMSDSIFAIYAEETGLAGSLFLISLLFTFLVRSFGVLKNTPDTFSRLLGGGITIWIVGQSFFNIAANIGLAPVAGIPLPYFSYGGSSMIAVLAASGVLLNISRYTK
ncbi:MAG: putative lipid II flippase FtsW [Candidatus Paceibacteria bacterium]